MLIDIYTPIYTKSFRCKTTPPLCLHCGKEFNLSAAKHDRIGWFTFCPGCGVRFYIDINNYLYPFGTKVTHSGGETGYIFSDTAEEANELNDIKYAIIAPEIFEEYQMGILSDEDWFDTGVYIPKDEAEECSGGGNKSLSD